MINDSILKAVLTLNGQKTFFNWITNILILCYPSKQALTLSISSVKLTIDRSVRFLLSPVDVSLLLEISWNSWKYWGSATPHIWALCPCLPWQCHTEAGEYLIDFLNTELYASNTLTQSGLAILSSPSSSPSPCPKYGLRADSKITWTPEGQTQVHLSLKEVSNIQPLYGIIIASQAHNLCKSSQGLTLSTVSLVYINVFRHVNGQFCGVKWKDFIKIWMEIKMRMARWQFCFSNVKSFVTNIATFLNICHIHCHNVKM